VQFDETRRCLAPLATRAPRPAFAVNSSRRQVSWLADVSPLIAFPGLPSGDLTSGFRLQLRGQLRNWGSKPLTAFPFHSSSDGGDRLLPQLKGGVQSLSTKDGPRADGACRGPERHDRVCRHRFPPSRVGRKTGTWVRVQPKAPAAPATVSGEPLFSTCHWSLLREGGRAGYDPRSQ
jgi:hypothetical protein